MLGVTDVAVDDPADQMLLEYGEKIGCADTYRTARVGAYLDTPGETVPDPYFGGEGPARTGCTTCGRCMIGCPVGAKNTLPKNYLWFAEKRGVRITPQRQVMTIRPLDERGEDGWEIVARALRRVAAQGPAGPPHARRRHLRRRARHEPAARAGARPTATCRDSRHASATSCGRTARRSSASRCRPDKDPGLINRVAINSSIYPDPHTHIETVVYGKGGGAMRGIFTLLTGDGSRAARPLKLLAPDRPPPAPVRGAHVHAGLVGAHDHRARHAVARQRDPARRQARPQRHASGCRPSRTRTARTRDSSRSPTTSPRGWPSAPAASRRRRSSSRCSRHPVDRPLPGRRGRRRDRAGRRRRRRPPRARLREPPRRATARRSRRTSA